MTLEPPPSRDADANPEDGPGAGLSSVRAVDRAVAILQSFTVETPLMSVVELQRRVGLSRPTLYRLLQTLATSGLIQAEGDPARFRLAHGVARLAHVWLSALDPVALARPLLEDLRAHTGETAALFVHREASSVCVLELTSRHVLAISRGIGNTGALTQGASGKAILAVLSEAARAPVMAALPSAGREAILQELAAVRRDGFAVSRGEVFAGAVAVAAPFLDVHGVVAGSIGVFGPAARIGEADVPAIGERVREAATALSTLLGHAPAAPVGTVPMTVRSA